MSIVCLGESLVDLIGEPPGRTPERYAVHFGGALANVAVGLARAGAPVALAGGTGTDEFGDLLRERLREEGVDLRHLQRLPELETPFAFVRLDPGGEPHFRIRGDGIEAGLAGHRGREAELVAGADALVIGSNTLAAEPGRSVTLAAVAAARRERVPVLFDPNLRPGRWQEIEVALELCRELAAGCLLIKTNLAEARLLADEPELDAPAAAKALSELGAELAVVTAGPEPAVARGVAAAECPPLLVPDPNPLGAGDAFMAALSAGLHSENWDPAAIERALAAAVAAGAEACRRVGAID